MFYNCLDRLFPTSAFRLSCTSPLSIDDFRTVVLLPELAVHLIMDDLGQDRTTAVDTLLTSINYGNFQFPLDLDDKRACNQMIRNAFRNVHASASTCDSQAIYRGGRRKMAVSNSNAERRVGIDWYPSYDFIIDRSSLNPLDQYFYNKCKI